MNRILLFFSALLFSVSLISQTNNEKIWDNLMVNNRGSAKELADDINTNKDDMESIVLKQLVNIESGIFHADKSFLPAFIQEQDMEYYLFALWNEPYIFTEYINDGFKKEVFDNIEFMGGVEYTHPQVSNAMNYLVGIMKRKINDFEAFNQYHEKINAIRTWQYCGAFENLNESGININYPPEKLAYSEEPFNANSNGFVNWYKPTKFKKDPYNFFSNHYEYGSGINYAQTFIHSDSEQTVYVNIGAGKAIKVWLNDILIFEKDKDRITDLDAYKIKLTIPEGNNRLLVKTTNDDNAFFIVRILDEKGVPLSNLTYSNQYSVYNKSTKEDINPILMPNIYETYFINKIAASPNNLFYKYCLISTYLRNSKEDKALEILAPLVEKYPKSSILRRILISIYLIEGEDTKVKEMVENIDNDDENYYYSQILKFADAAELFRKDVDEMNRELDKIANSTDIPIVKTTTNLFKVLREGDKAKTHLYLDEIVNEAREARQAKLMITFSSFYKKIFNENKATEKIYKEVIKDYYYPTAYYKLSNLYDEENKNKKSLELYSKLVDLLPGNNYVLIEKIDKLFSMHKYKETLPLIELGLKQFPYSFTLMRKKGRALQQLNRKEEAVVWYKKSLSYDGGNSSLRDRIDDLENKQDPFKGYVTTEAYDYIKDNRGKIEKNNFGINFLLNETNVLLYPIGGLKIRSVSIYEVTSEKGISLLKEYSLGLRYNYSIIKSEIVKPNGSLIPAEKSGSDMVFNGLSVGDVIYIDYEKTKTSTGRFYKEFVDDNQFDFLHPCLISSYRLFAPKSFHIYSEMVNGEIPFTKKELDELTLYEWEDINTPAMPSPEDYMPNTKDVARILHISTLDSWEVIANWYSDLVGASIEYNKTVNDVFDGIFPEGYESLSETQRAELIYNYIADNISYSYVDFKQSGFIPQKPSKTINSKLGDCKDVSTLFLVLGRKAGLKVNLVLVSTNGNGQKELILPSTDFNHCIAKVKLDDTDQFVELTNKYLPFKSLPSSLLSATALEIPFDKTDKVNSNLFKLKDVAQTKTILKSNIVYTIYKDKKELTITQTGQGRICSVFNEMLDEDNQEVLETSILEFFEGKDDLDLELVSYKILPKSEHPEQVKFQATFLVKNKLQKIGKSTIFKLPLRLHLYTADIISLDERKYPIEYRQYENVDQYQEEFTIVLKNGKHFSDIPEDVSGSFKKQSFSQIFKKVSPNKLEVKMIGNTTPDEDISIEEYSQFKKYAQEYIDLSNNFISFE